MKALLLNSGRGTRMGDATKLHPKCMTSLCTGQTILSRQLAQLTAAGISDCVVTTGPFEQALVAHAKTAAPAAHFEFVQNPDYAATNYIYSIYLAREYLDDDILLLHGDLVFDDAVLDNLLRQPHSAMSVCAANPLPENDFKAVLEGGRIRKIGIEYFERAVAAQPLYRLQKADWRVWLASIVRFVEMGRRGVYAENAFNAVSEQCHLLPFDTGKALCAEVDTLQDLQKINFQMCKICLQGGAQP